MAREEFIFPQCTIQIKNMAVLADTKFIVAGGRRPAEGWLSQATAGYEIYCADKGGQYCYEAGIVPKELFGDGDSAAAGIYDLLRQQGTVIHRFNPLKDDTDLQLVLSSVPRANLLVSGIWGGRFDHLYSNIFSLLAYKRQWQGFTAMADEQELLIFLAGGEQIELHPAVLRSIKSVSLLPLTAVATVSLDNVYWPLQAEQLTQLRPYAVSNVPLADFTCTCHTGELGLYICFKNN